MRMELIISLDNTTHEDQTPLLLLPLVLRSADKPNCPAMVSVSFLVRPADPSQLK